MKIDLKKAFILSVVMKQVLQEEGQPAVDLFPYLLRKSGIENTQLGESGPAFMRRMGFERSLANYTKAVRANLITMLSGPPEKIDNMMIFKFKKGTRLLEFDLNEVKQNILDHAANTPLIVLDLTNVDYLGKPVIGNFIGLHRLLGEFGKALIILGPQEHIFETFEITKLDKMFTVCKTFDELKGKINSGMIKIYTSKAPTDNGLHTTTSKVR